MLLLNWQVLILWLSLLVSGNVVAWTQDNVAVLEQFEYIGDSHFKFGQHIGTRFREKIHSRILQNIKLQSRLLPFIQTTTRGREVYNTFLHTHETKFPDYVEELRGIANGSDLPFETIFVMNLSEEIDDSIPTDFILGDGRRLSKTMHCSDLVVIQGNTMRLVVHNEDSGVSDLNHTAIIIAKIGTAPKFVAYTYLGDLPSGAFGFNEHGVAFTLNFVQPADIQVGGLARGFVSRDLLAATSVPDAFDRITIPLQSAGHNYQIMDIYTTQIWNAEVASFNRYASQELTASVSLNASNFFHANQYQLLNVSQPPYESSIRRLQRYQTWHKPITTLDGALWLLGDQSDHQYPIYHDVRSHERGDLSGWTLTTVVYDLINKTATLYRGNPRHHQVEYIWDLELLTSTKLNYEAQSIVE